MSARVAVRYTSVNERSTARAGTDGGIFVPRTDLNAWGGANAGASTFAAWTLSNNLTPASGLPGGQARWYKPMQTSSGTLTFTANRSYVQPLQVARAARIKAIMIEAASAPVSSTYFQVGIWPMQNAVATSPSSTGPNTRMGYAEITGISTSGIITFSTAAQLRLLADAILYPGMCYLIGVGADAAVSLRTLAGAPRTNHWPYTIDATAFNNASSGAGYNTGLPNSITVMGNSFQYTQGAHFAYAMKLANI